MASLELNRPTAPAPHRNRHPHSQWGAVADRNPDLIEAINEADTIRAARERVHSDRVAPDRMSGFLTGGSFVLAIAVWLIVSPIASIPFAMLAACILAETVAASIEFEIGPGTALPTTPVLYVSLFLLPPQLVPIVPLGGLLGAAAVGRYLDRDRHERVSVLAGSSWHAMGPAFVFSMFTARGLGLDAIGVYALALIAQMACDAAASWVRNCWGLGVPANQLLEALRFTFLVDLTLAPIGIAAAIAAPGSATALLFLIGPIALLLMLERDRERHIDRAVVLSEAFVQSADRARRDVLTGLRNRLAWEEAVAHNNSRQAPVGVVLADVDGLKATNDLLGHDAGDRLLVAIARIIADATPADTGAISARLGGDEFGILLPGPMAHKTLKVAESLRKALAASSATAKVGKPRVSASVGHGVARYGWEIQSAFGEADRGVYEDKAARSIGRL